MKNKFNEKSQKYMDLLLTDSENCCGVAKYEISEAIDRIKKVINGTYGEFEEQLEFDYWD